MKKLFVLFLLLGTQLLAQTGDYVYKTVSMRAAPGKLLQLIGVLKADMQIQDFFPFGQPQLMRHSQGDQWDLLLVIPVGDDFTDYFAQPFQELLQQSKTQAQPYGSPYYDLISWQEEGFYHGPDLPLFEKRFNEMDYYHVEMFIALAGKQKELLKQRQMENVYLAEINREPNFIFTKIMGSSFDNFTVGLYRDIKHFAESADIPLEKENQAAQKAGFESVFTIGSYLRSLLLKHHDTLAGAVRLE